MCFIFVFNFKFTDLRNLKIIKFDLLRKSFESHHYEFLFASDINADFDHFKNLVLM